MKKLAVIYDRSSTDQQQDNWSREDAKTIGFALAEKLGFEAELKPTEVVSGESLTNRPIMMGILDEIKAGKVGAIIVQNFSRLSRDEDSIDGLTIKAICRESDCLVITPQRVYDFNNDADDRQSDLELLIGKWYKQEFVRNTLTGMKAKAKTGGFLGGVPVLGYDIVYPPQTSFNVKPVGKLEINQTEAEVVRILFEIYNSGIGANQTAKRLNKSGYRKTRKNADAARRFTANDVLRIVRDPIYCGLKQWGKQAQSRYLKDWEAELIERPDLRIIPVETWKRAQEIAQKRSRSDLPEFGKWGKYVLTGILKCANCGGSMTGVTPTYKLADGTKKKASYYRCHSRSQIEKRHLCPEGHLVRQDSALNILIPFVAEQIKAVIDLTDTLESTAEKMSNTPAEDDLIQSYNSELLVVADRKKRVVDSISAGVITQVEAKHTLDELRRKEESIKRDLEQLAKKDAIKSEYETIIKVLKEKDIVKELRRMFELDQNVFKRILNLVFEPNSVVLVNTTGKRFNPDLEMMDYQLTEQFEQFTSCFNRVRGLDKMSYVIDLSELFVSA